MSLALFLLVFTHGPSHDELGNLLGQEVTQSTFTKDRFLIWLVHSSDISKHLHNRVRSVISQGEHVSFGMCCE